MTFHYLDPRHGEPCAKCEDGEVCEFLPLIGERWIKCPACAGTGKRGGDAEPVIKTWRYDGSLADSFPAGWYWEVTLGKRAHSKAEKTHAGTYGPFPTDADALFAARCALAGVQVCGLGSTLNGPTDSFYWWPASGAFGKDRDGSYPTRDAALCAALDARGSR
jgi:hypothetical protein